MMTTPRDGEPVDEDVTGSARPQLTRKQWVLVALGLAVLTAIAAVYGLGAAAQPVRWQDVGYTVDSPTEASVTFDVFLYTDEPVTCHVHAMNVQFAEVGVAQTQVLPDDGAEQRITLPMTTVEEANSAVVRVCMLAE